MNKQQQKEFIDQCFQSLIQRGVISAADLTPSTVTTKDIQQLERKWEIKLPALFKTYLMAYHYKFDKLIAVVPKLHGEYKEQWVQIFTLPEENTMQHLEEYFTCLNEALSLTKNGYVRIGDWGDGWGALCLKLNLSGKSNFDRPLVWFDHEEVFHGDDLLEKETDTGLGFRTFLECYFMDKYAQEDRHHLSQGLDETKPTKGDVHLTQQDQKMVEEMQEEIFDRVADGVYVKKDDPKIEDVNEACHSVVCVSVYGFQEYTEKIADVIDINYVNPRFHTSMLHECFSAGNWKPDIAEDLIGRGIDVDIQDWNGNTALFYLVGFMEKEKCLDIIQLILAQKPNLNLLNKKGQSILWMTTYYAGAVPRQEVSNLLQQMVDTGADPGVLPVALKKQLEEIVGSTFWAGQ